MPPRERLHQLVDRLPESETQTALQVLSLLVAPFDDEPYPEEQQKQDEEARLSPRLSHEDLRHDLGL
jgi:hypothetical protein